MSVRELLSEREAAFAGDSAACEVPAPIFFTASPLDLEDIPKPQPRLDEVLLRIHACGVCHTELDEIEGRAAPTKLPIVLGHEIVDSVVEYCGHVICLLGTRPSVAQD